MRKAETAFGAGILAFGALFLEETLKLPYFVEEVPGPGFLPFWISLGIICLGLVLTARGIYPGGQPSAESEWPDAAGWWRILVTLGSLAVSILLLEAIGFLVVAALFVIVVAVGLGMRSWGVLVPVSLLSAIVLYGVFAVWLKVPLPAGLLSILG